MLKKGLDFPTIFPLTSWFSGVNDSLQLDIKYHFLVV